MPQLRLCLLARAKSDSFCANGMRLVLRGYETYENLSWSECGHFRVHVLAGRLRFGADGLCAKRVCGGTREGDKAGDLRRARGWRQTNWRRCGPSQEGGQAGVGPIRRELV